MSPISSIDTHAEEGESLHILAYKYRHYTSFVPVHRATGLLYVTKRHI